MIFAEDISCGASKCQGMVTVIKSYECWLWLASKSDCLASYQMEQNFSAITEKAILLMEA